MSSKLSSRPRSAGSNLAGLVGVLATGLVLATFAPLPSFAAAPDGAATTSSTTAKTAQVVVTNDATRPVPTQAQGTTQVAGNVQVAGSVVAAQAGELVQFQKAVIIDSGSPSIEVIGLYEVPDGKRLVVEHVTAARILHPEGRMQVRVGTQGAMHYLPFQSDPNSDSDTLFARATANEPMTFFVDDAGSNALELKVQLLLEGPRRDVSTAQVFTFVGRLFDR